MVPGVGLVCGVLLYIQKMCMHVDKAFNARITKPLPSPQSVPSCSAVSSG